MHTRPLKPLSPGDSVRMQLPGQKAWSPGVCAGLVGPRSYEVKVGDRTFVRNRRHLIKSEEPVVEDTPEVEESTKQEESAEVTPSQTNVQQPAETPPFEIAPDHTLHSPGLRRSGRNKQYPDHFGNFVYY